MTRPQLIIFGLIGLAVLVLILIFSGIAPGLKEPEPEPFTLIIWSPRSDKAIWEDAIISRYIKEVPSATIEYEEKNPLTYDAELINALAAGSGPDAFVVTGTDLDLYLDKISPLQEGSSGYGRRDMKNIFADGVVAALTDKSGALLAAPLSLDTLALFYNRDAFNAANIPNPPGTWEELLSQSKSLTRLSSVGGIQRSGVALGTAANIAHASDILATLIMQSGGAFTNATGDQSALSGQATVSAINFYTSFAASAKKTYSWNSSFRPSLTAFAAGDAAMAFGYAADIPSILGENPQLNFDIAPFPQPAEAKNPLSLGQVTAVAVTRTSKNKEQTWRFLLWLRDKDAQKTYADAVGLAPARRDLAAAPPPREFLASFYDQVLSAKTMPTALGKKLTDVLTEMIEGVSTRRLSIDRAVAEADNNVNIFLRTMAERPVEEE